jgi:hypothetical protein
VGERGVAQPTKKTVLTYERYFGVVKNNVCVFPDIFL